MASTTPQPACLSVDEKKLVAAVYVYKKYLDDMYAVVAKAAKRRRLTKFDYGVTLELSLIHI